MSSSREDDRGRPIFDPILYRSIDELRSLAPPELGHLDPDRVLFVVGAARRESRASIRPLTFGLERDGSPILVSPDGRWKKPEIRRNNQVQLYEICLRPRFFLQSNPDERAHIFVHELWHAALAFDGTLEASRRHRSDTGGFEKNVTAIARRWRTSVFAYRGELRLSSWLSRPPSRLPRTMKDREGYDERDLFSAIVEQR